MTPIILSPGQSSLYRSGPIIRVGLAKPTSRSPERRETLWMDALIDTGASATVVRTGTHAKLDIDPSARTQATTASEKGVELMTFESLLWVQETDPKRSLRAWVGLLHEARDPEKGIRQYECILGRDFLSFFDLEYRGRRGEFTLSFADDSPKGKPA